HPTHVYTRSPTSLATPHSFFSLIPPRPPRSTLFPYTTLFRSDVTHMEVLVSGLGPQEVSGLPAGVETFRAMGERLVLHVPEKELDRKSTRLNSSHVSISYAVFCLKKKKIII